MTPQSTYEIDFSFALLLTVKSIQGSGTIDTQQKLYEIKRTVLEESPEQLTFQTKRAKIITHNI